MLIQETDVLEQRFSVSFRYPVYFTVDVFSLENPLLAKVLKGEGDEPRRVLALFDTGLVEAQGELVERLRSYAKRWAEALTLAGGSLLVHGGEQAKNDAALPARLHRLIDEAGLCRHSCVLSVGGGALQDLAGFVAATAHGGVRCIRVPTTVLSQCDCGVGVKNGINAFGKKNFLGTFAPPYAVINDAYFLLTLDDRDWMAGVAEAIKVALLRDARFFTQLEAAAPALLARDLRAMRAVVRRCAELHLEHIAAGDPFESGSSRPLDYGHWSAHKLEQLTAYRLRHGEAVAIGMALDAAYAQLLGMLPCEDLESILALLARLGFRLFVPELYHGELFDGLEEFRQHLGGKLTITLLSGVGRAVDVHDVDRERYREAIELLASRHKSALHGVS